MKIDLQNGDLFTNAGKFLKRLHCPKDAEWDKMTGAPSLGARTCRECSRIVHDTSAMTEEEIEQLLKREPASCLKVSLSQDNCNVIPRGGGDT
jgi:hypothetical protein